MKDEELRGLMAEFAKAQTDAMGLVVAAISGQLDVTRLAADLRAQIEAANASRSCSKVAISIATGALAAADAQSALRNPAKH